MSIRQTECSISVSHTSSPYFGLWNHCRSVSRSVIRAIERHRPWPQRTRDRRRLLVRCVENHEFSKLCSLNRPRVALALRLSTSCPAREAAAAARCPSLTRHCASPPSTMIRSCPNMTASARSWAAAASRGGVLSTATRTVPLSSNRPNSASWAPLDQYPCCRGPVTLKVSGFIVPASQAERLTSAPPRRIERKKRLAVGPPTASTTRSTLAHRVFRPNFV